MPDDTSTALTAKPIPGSLTIGSVSGPMNIAPRNMAEAIEFARVMSKAGVLLREPFRDNPGLCLGVSLQAWRSNADPFALASKAYVVNNQIAYESQAIHALVNTSPLIARRLRATYSGEGAKRRCKITGWIRGEDEAFEYESPCISDIKVKNSPLWQSDPDQQLFYLSSRAWARRHVPEILLGIYTTDEIEGQIIDVTADRIDAHAAALQPAQPEPEPWAVYDYAGNRYEFKTAESAAEAFRKVLIAAAAQEGEALKTAWDNNYGDDLLLGRISEDLFAPLNRLYDELAPQDSPAPDQSQQKGEATLRADGNGPQPNSDQPAGETSAPDDPAQRSAADPSTQAPAAERPYQEPRDEARAETPPAGAASGEERAPPAADLSRFQGMPEPQTADRHDPFWDRDSLRIEPPTGRTGKPDYKAWSALIMPRIRQAWSVPLVNELMTANQDVIDLYASNFGSRARDELTGLFEDAKNRLS